MPDFDIDGTMYRTNRKLNAFEQLHVARKIAPLIVQLAPGAQSGQTSFLAMISPMVRGMAEMEEEDINYIVQRCASVVQRNQGPSIWAPIWNNNAKQMMFDDIDGMQLLRIAIAVMQENLSNFMSAPASIFQSLSPTTSDTLAS